MNHREALTKGLEDFQRMLTEVRSSNGVLTEQLKQFEALTSQIKFSQRAFSSAAACQTALLTVAFIGRVPSTTSVRPMSTLGDN